MDSSTNIAVAYVPVLHAGYFQFFAAAVEAGASCLYLVGDDILMEHEELDYLARKDRLRAIPVEDMRVALTALLAIPVSILHKDDARNVTGMVIAPHDDVTKLLAREYFKDAKVVTKSIFLRWHRDNTAEEKAIEPHRAISVSAAEHEFMSEAMEESEESFDWWRQIGAVLVQEGKVIMRARNKHMPDEQSTNINGDPRAVYKKGININLTTAAHAEMQLIAAAARAGISLTGASLYVTEFPCPYCARLIAHSGIKKCYFSHGYAVLDGEDILKAAGVELIYIDMKKEQG